MASRGGAKKRQHTIRQCLADLGITAEGEDNVFASCEDRDDEFRIIKKQYFKQCRTHHPDKGGEAAMFRLINTSFELLRDLHTGKTSSRKSNSNWLFSDALQGSSKPPASGRAKATDNKNDEEAFDMSQYDFDFSNQEMPSWEYYEAAAEEDMPIYRVELAKSARSRCTASGKYKACHQKAGTEPPNDGETCTEVLDPSRKPELIEKSEIRVGWMDGQAGTYGGWRHLRCWRVPNKVWMGLPDPDKCHDVEKFATAFETMNDYLLSGFAELPEAEKAAFIYHCRDRSHWTARRKPKDKIVVTEPAEQSAPPPAASSSRAAAVTSDAIVLGRQKFVVPQPGINGASAATVFAGKRFVLTGVFPEIGGGHGLTLGKYRLKEMIHSFGGRVTGSISGKTDVLVVGKDPGFSKVSKARERDGIFMASIKELKEGLDAGASALEDFGFCSREEPMKIQSFSTGYVMRNGGNGLALEASAEELAFAQGFRESPKKPSAKKQSSKKPSTSSSGSSGTPLVIEDERKPAAKNKSDGKQKRKAQDGVPSSSKREKKSKSAATKKRKTAKQGTTKSSQQSETINGDDKAIVKVSSDDDDEEDVITCDNCGNECTDESWFLEKTEEDFCPPCHLKKQVHGASLQRFGKPVE